MSARSIRRIIIATFIAGVAGMIVGSIADSNAWAMTFGLITAAAALQLITLTTVLPPTAFKESESFEQVAQELEAQVNALVDDGVSEEHLRILVRTAVKAGQQRNH